MSLENGNAVVELRGDIYSETPIDWTGEPVDEDFITIRRFREVLDPIRDAPQITFRINSRGGDLYSGIAIYNEIKSLSGHTTAVIDAVAASAASIICAGADEVLAMPSSTYMIHEGHVYLDSFLTPEDLNRIQSEFDSSTKAMINIYQERTGQPVETIEQWIKQETWFAGEEIVMAGFADRLVNADLSDIESDLDKLHEDISEVLENGINEPPEEDPVVADESEDEQQVPEDPEDPQEDIEAEEISENQMSELEEAQDVIEEIQETIDELQEEDRIEASATEIIAALRSKYPKVAKLLISEGIRQERSRMRDIDSISANLDPKLVASAKYAKPMSAKSLALEALKTDSVSARVLSGMRKDARVASAVSARVPSDTSLKYSGNKQVNTDIMAAIKAVKTKGASK